MEDLKKKVLPLIQKALENKKGIDIRIIDISKISLLADYFVLCSGSNKTQVRALADYVTDELAKIGYSPKHTEGYSSAEWILLDYEDIIIHIFTEESRHFYDLERIWREGITVERSELI